MIRQLRRKFILVAMISVVAVLSLLLGVINAANYLQVEQEADALLGLLSDNSGTFPHAGMAPDRPGRPSFEFSPETPFETRFFTVKLAADGTVLSVGTGSIAAITTEAAGEYAQKAAAAGRESGWQGVYRFTSQATAEGTLYVFLDRSRELSTMRSFLFTSLLVSAGGILAVFGLLVLFSGRILRPVAESYQKQKRFITDASHELKTPLTVIDANTEVLELEQGSNEWTQSIRHQVQRLAALTENLVALCRMDEETVQLVTAEFDLSEAVCDTLSAFETPARVADKQLTGSVQPGITVNGSERAIRQLLTQLLDNAVKYATDGGRIHVALYRQGKRTVLECYNTADNLPGGDLNVLFERFYRADAARTGGGSGIGLSVAKAIVAAHGGRITAATPDGRSLLITVVLDARC